MREYIITHTWGIATPQASYLSTEETVGIVESDTAANAVRKLKAQYEAEAEARRLAFLESQHAKENNWNVDNCPYQFGLTFTVQYIYPSEI